MKKCSKCRMFLDREKFGRKTNTSDGLREVCKSCHREAKREWGLRRTDVAREAKRRNRKSEVGRRRSPEKNLARQMVRTAIKQGRLSRPEVCEACGKPWDHIHGHHRDYSKPLEVVWLCAPYHGAEHAREATR